MKVFKNISDRGVRQKKTNVVNKPLLTNEEVYLRWQELRTLNEIKGVESLNISNKNHRRPRLSETHENKRKVWAGDNLKTDFSKVVFTENSKVRLDSPDSWSDGWVPQDREALIIKRRQQGRGIIMWAGSCSNKLIGPYVVDDGGKVGVIVNFQSRHSLSRK